MGKSCSYIRLVLGLLNVVVQLHSVLRKVRSYLFYVLLSVHLSIFISVINQLDAQNFVLQ